MFYVIQVGRRYFSARRGYNGGLTTLADATRFSQSDAIERAGRIVGATVTRAPE